MSSARPPRAAPDPVACSCQDEGAGASLGGLARVAVRGLGTGVAMVCVRRREGWSMAGCAGTACPGEGRPYSIGDALLDELAAAAPVCVEDARVDLRLRRESPADGRAIGALLAAPIGSGEAALFLAVEAQPRSWSGDDVELLTDLALAAATELERERVARRVSSLEAALTRGREEYRLLFENARTIILSVDPHGLIREVNPAGTELLGGGGEVVAGRHFSEFVAPEDLDRALALAAAPDESAGTDIELRALRPNGERRLVQAHAVSMREEGVRVGVYVIARDVTEERAREMQFRRAERMASVGPLLSGVCHELNNPLTSIKSFAELLLLDERPAEDREAIEIVQREAERAAKIVSDLRLVARQGRGGATDRAEVELNDVVRHVLRLREEGLTAQRVSVQTSLEVWLPPVWAVRAQLEEVLHQLISNAEQAMQAGDPRTLVVRTRRSGDSVAVTVEDSGCGIPEETRDRIFDPFWTTRGGEGTGLGLSIVQGIVTDHGGTIDVDSSPGRGTWFTVALPASAEIPTTMTGPSSETRSVRPLRVLVADDEAAIRFSLTRYLERRGHVVVEAEDGAGALARVADCDPAAPFDMVVADVRMPGMTASELWRRLGALGTGLDERLIFITGDTDLDDIDSALEASGVPMVQKPFELAEIAQIIETHASVAGS